MENLRKKQEKEAKLRKEMLIQQYHLKPEALDLEKLKQNKQYKSLIETVEKENDRLVYYGIVTYDRILNLLFVSKYEEDWEVERPYEDGNYVIAYTIDLEENYTEIGDIFLDEKNGELIRVN